MFLSKRRKVSTKTTLKSEALKFLQTFRQEHKSAKACPSLLSRFTEDYRAYSRTVHRPKSTDSAGTALRELLGVLEDRTLRTRTELPFHTEIRWSHGKFCGHPEAKLSREFPWASVPFFRSIL